MNKVLLSTISALAIVSVVFGADSTEFGVLKVPSSAKETVVGVPWLASAATNANVKVADLVLTANLSVNDQLMYYTGVSEGSACYETWILKQDDSGNKYWKSATTVSDDGLTKSAGAADRGLPPGGAIFLKRADPGAFFYIMGKPLSSGGTMTMGAGWSLIAPPSVADTDVNTGITWTGVVTGDQLFIPTIDSDSLVTLSYIGGKWKKWDASNHKWVSEGIVISAGVGAWFKNSTSETKYATLN